MTAPGQSPAGGCEFCDKQGLAILPVRYAVANAGSKTPEARLPGSESVTDIELGAGGYTLRSVREGFVYVYDEAKDQWDGYVVVSGNYLFRFDPDLPLPDPEQIHFTCSRQSHGLLASCITIDDPDHATRVWFGFSDVPWTRAVLKRHGSAAERARHMRCLDVRAWMASHSQPHATSVSELESTVADYALRADEAQTAFGWSMSEFWSKQDLAGRLIHRINALYPEHGLILALDDAPGIAQDIAALMQFRTEKFIRQEDLARGLAVSSAIQQLETAVKDQAELREIRAGQQLADQYESGSVAGAPVAAGLGTRVDEKTLAYLRNPTSAALKKAADREWARYTAKYDEPERARWQAKTDARLKALDSQIIAPLARAHAAWMTGVRLAASFECNFDENDIDNGVAYAGLLTLCLAGTQDKKACFDVYVDWLCGDITDKTNLLLRALGLNYEPTAQHIHAAMQARVSWETLPWDGLISAYQAVTSQMHNGQTAALGELVAAVNGPIAKVANAAASSGIVYNGLVALGVISGHGMARVELTGTRAEFKRLLMRELSSLSGQPVSGKGLRRHITAELRRLKAHGYKLNDTVTLKWLLLADPAHIDAMPEQLSAAGRAQWLTNSLRHPEQVEALRLSRWKLRVQQSGFAHGAGVFSLGVLGGILQFAALSTLLESDAKALAHARPELRRRIAAQYAALAGTIADITGQGVQKLGAMRGSGNIGRGLTATGANLSRFGRGLGIFGGLAIAGFDFWRGTTELREGNIGTSAGFFSMSILGVIATAALSIGAIPLVVTLILGTIALSLFMGYLVDNAIQDWLERCYLWGKLEAYPDAETEIRELKLVTQG